MKSQPTLWATMLLIALIGHTATAAESALPTIPPDVASKLAEARVIAQEANEPSTQEISLGCVPNPLPTTEIGTSWTTFVDETFMGLESHYQLTAWRYPCPNGTDFQLMVTLLPTQGPTHLLSPFAITQNDRNYNVTPVKDESKTPFGTTLTQISTVMLAYTGNQAQSFDDDRALQIKVLRLGGSTVTLSIPDAPDGNDPGNPPEPVPFQIDGRLRGSYGDHTTTGQGFLFDVNDEGEWKGFYGAWFIASPIPGKEDQHDWLTFAGPYEGNTATVDIYYVTGQRFQQKPDVVERKVGTATIVFESCEAGTMEYSLPEWGKSGTLDLVRVSDSPRGCAGYVPSPPSP